VTSKSSPKPNLNSTAMWQSLAVRIEEFVNSWESATMFPPDMAQHLVNVPGGERRLTLIELIKVDLEYRWNRDFPKKTCEDYLADFEELKQDLPLELLYEEFHVRMQAGESADDVNILQRFPEQAQELRPLLGTAESQQETTLIHRTAKKKLQFQAGERIDDFDLLKNLGEGAFGMVFLAWQRSMQRQVALKVTADRGSEPQTLAQLDHENIIRVYDQRSLPDEGLRLMYMQYASGGTIKSVIDHVRGRTPHELTGLDYLAAIDAELRKRGIEPPTNSGLRQRIAVMKWPELVCWLGGQMARSLHYAYGKGVLHRDIKPANVLLTEEGVPKLADFNISFSAKLEGSTPLAYFGGSLAYMSPEQLEANSAAYKRTASDLDNRSDLYSLGVLLWELLTLQRPFDQDKVEQSWGHTIKQMLFSRENGARAESLNPSVNQVAPGLPAVLCRCLSHEREGRNRDGAELARDFEFCLFPETQRLLYPRSSWWTRVAQHFPVTTIVGLTLIPNAIAGVLNYHYNHEAVVQNMKNAEGVFALLVVVLNSTLFTAGILIGIYRMSRVGRYVWNAPARAKLSDEECERVRVLATRLGHEAAMIGVVLWILGGILFPVLMHIGLKQGEVPMYIHFVSSLILCGLIAAVYPFYIVTLLSLHRFYPLLVRLGTMHDEDRRALENLRRWSWIYLGLAALVPLIAGAMLAMIQSPSRWAAASSAFIGIAGVAAAWFAVRRIQQDIDALEIVTRMESGR
jgi:serine/threonine protein kinase